MSLVILSNDASESTIAGQKSSIFKPYSFRNSLTSTMTIPANAEVALQSCKICLDGSLGVTGGRRVFYMFLGEVIDLRAVVAGAVTNINQTLSAPIRIPLFPDSTEVLNLTHEEITEEITRALNGTIDSNKRRTGGGGGLFHPNYVSDVGAQLSNVVVSRDGVTGEIIGFEFQIKYFAQAVSVLTSNARALAMVDLAVDSFTRDLRVSDEYGGTGGTLVQVTNRKPYTMTTDGVSSVILTPKGAGAGDFQAANQPMMGTTFASGPISLFNGQCNFDITNCTFQRGAGNDKKTRFLCGMTRFNTMQGNAPNGRPIITRFNPNGYIQQAGKFFYRNASAGNDMRWFGDWIDFGICVNEDGILRVIHTVEGDDAVPYAGDDRVDGGEARGSAKMQQVDYTRGGTTAAPFDVVYDMHANARDYTNVRFTCSGAVVKVELQTAAQFGAGTGDVLLELALAAPVISQNFKPICQNCWNLQPIMGINNHLQIGNAEGHVPQDYDIRLTNIQCASATAFNSATPQFQPSWFQTIQERATPQGLAQYRDLELRWKNIDLATKPYPNVDLANEKFTRFAPVMITAPSASYTPSPDANCRELFGFDNQTDAIQDSPPWTAANYAGGPPAITTTTLTSTSIPTSKSTKSIFVRLDNFNQESTNAGNGNPSRIIAHLPRFDGQAETGRLFFEPSTLVYLDLNNPAPLKVNQLDISMVYADERLVTGLTGTTILVLHFRHKETHE